MFEFDLSIPSSNIPCHPEPTSFFWHLNLDSRKPNRVQAETKMFCDSRSWIMKWRLSEISQLNKSANDVLSVSRNKGK
jgi:hypothetical protein